MKLCLLLIMLMVSALANAESQCDVRIGQSQGLKVIEFASDHIIHSKMSLKGTTADAILEEMISLQDMSICTEKILAKKCVLKFEKQPKANILTLYRGEDRWVSWLVSAKNQGQRFVKSMQKVGFCQ